MTRDDVMTIHAKYSGKPRKADRYIQTIRFLLNFAIYQRRWNIDNVAEKIELYGRQREYEPWPDWMIERLDNARQNVKTAVELILGTGQRPNAAIIMRRDQFNGEWMTLIDEKQDEAFEVFCPAPLRRHLDTLPIKGQHILAKNLTQPLGYDSVEREFRAWRSSLGDEAKKYSMHGLRKLAIIRLAEAGCSDAQIQAITNQSPEMVAYYRRRANRKRLSRTAHEATERNESKT